MPRAVRRSSSQISWRFGKVPATQLPAANDAALLKRLGNLPEDRVLDYFWLMDRNGAPRPWLLEHLGHVVLNRPLDWDRAVIRRQHESGARAGTIRLNKRCCFGCSHGHCALYHHHVIEIQNGGSNASRNIVPLCFDCHKRLHPWLKEQPAKSGLVQVREIARNVKDADFRAMETA